MNVKFGDVVKEVKSNVDRANNPYEFYVAGDHMDSEDFRIHRHGCFATDDVGPAFVRIFHPGQVLYGSRRTYLKKVCVADFDGVCSNTTFVLETRDENVLVQRLLPFLLLSNGFTEWSIKHSKGSTNPYVLFSDLAGYEFDLPPLDEQKKLSELLWAANDLKESYKKAITATDEMLKAKFREMFGECGVDDARGGAETQSVLLRDATEVILDGEHGSVPRVNDGYLFLSARNIQADDRIHLDAFTRISKENYERIARRFNPCNGDLLLTCAGTIGNVAIVPEMEPFVADRGIMLIRPDKSKVIAKFLFYTLKSDDIVKQMRSSTHATALAHLYIRKVQELQIPLPPISLQREFVAIADKAESAKANLKKSIAALDQVMKGLING